MPFLADVAGRRAAVELAAAHPEATATDLAVALVGHVAGDARPHAGPADPVLVVDGREVPGSTPLASLGPGPGAEVLVRRRDAVPPPPGRESSGGPSVAELRVVGGLRAGGRVALAPGRHVIGHAAPSVLTVDDPTMSAVHAELRVEAGQVHIADAGSTNGTWLDGTAIAGATTLGPGASVRLGATEVTVGDDPGADPVPLPFNRPPRRLDPSPHHLLHPPTAPAPASPPLPVGVVAALAPALVGIVMVLVLHSLVWGALALLGPVTVVGGSWEQRRRVARRRARDVQQFRRRVADLAAALAAASEVEAARLQRLLPDPAEAIRRVEAPSRHLWERRPAHPDWLALRAGTGPVGWTPPVAGDPGSWAPEVAAAVHTAARLPHAPVALDLARGGVAGIAGPRDAALAVARSLVLQAAAAHGPADLLLGVVADDDRAGAWDWCSWLPHALGDTGTRPLVDPAELVVPRHVTLLLVVDVAAGLGRDAPARPLLQRDDGSVAGIVLADRADRLPSCCTTVVELTDDLGAGRVTSTRGGTETPELLAAGVTEAVAATAARASARLEDPEAAGSVVGLPHEVRLLDLIDPERSTGSRAVAPIGVGPDGRTVEVDLDRDGPHVLVAGTTGAGKSELLRTLVAGLALGAPPELLTFLLVDFKGGSAFDRLAALPHTVGVVSDLDRRLAERALRCLEAELRWREQQLRTTGAADVAEHRRLAPAGAPPVPRLVVVVDEFATLASDVPDVLDALVAAAQRGRSLGVNLVLATQRPAGAVSDNIRANVALRIALRLHDAADSVDVIGAPDAADLPRSVPGRALLRRGPDGPDVAQLAHVSRAAPPPDHRRVTLVPFGCGPAPRPPSAGPGAVRSGPTDLDSIVDACQAAFAARGAPPPRPVWTPPLPDDLPLSRLPSRGGEVVVGQLDVPDEQTRLDLAWQPTAGPLLLVGAAGSGLTTTLATLALQATAAPADPPTHLYVLDGAGNGLRALAGLAGAGDVVGPADRARQRRLVRRLGDELRDRRRGPDGAHPAIVLLVDDVGSLLRAWDDPLDDVLDRLGELVADGTASGVHVVLAAERLGAVPVSWQAAAVQRWLFRAADPFEHAGHAVPAGPPGRVTALPSGHLGQVARPDAGLAAAVDGATAPWPDGWARPAPVGELPARVHAGDLHGAARLDAWPWALPVGIGEHHLAPVGWTLHGGDAVLVAGPRRSGRSTVLAGLAATVAAGGGPAVVVVAPDRSPLARVDGPFERLPAPAAAAEVRALLERPRPVLLLVDDAELLPDDGHGLDALLAERPSRLVTVVAAAAEVVRSRYGHLARAVGRGGLGLLLQPDPDLDGDLLGVRLPRRAPVALTPGRGWLVGDRDLEVVQTPLNMD